MAQQTNGIAMTRLGVDEEVQVLDKSISFEVEIGLCM